MKSILKFVKYSFATLGAFIVIAITGIWAYSMAYNIYNRPNLPNLVANILEIEAPPKSLEVIDCESPFATDVLTTCAIRMEPEEFEKLLVGYQFKHTLVKHSSHSVGSVSVGPEFEVTNQYIVFPKEFTQGGTVCVYANKNKDQAIVDLYIE